jgi:ribonuclease G
VEKELVINSTPTEVEIALVENRKLVEIHSQKTNDNFAVGDIFLGRIKKLVPNLNAAFVDIGPRKDAFLHYTDLGPQIRSLTKYTKLVQGKHINTHLLDNFNLEPDNSKHGKIDQVFERNQNVLVQILKEPISTKGPRLSCEITIPGRYVVLAPFSDVIAISKKIGNSEERKRLKLLIESIKPKKFGVIVRTAAEGKKVADLHTEIRELSERWEQIYAELHGNNTPRKLLSEIDKTSSILRDILTDSFNRITINDKSMYTGLKDYLKSIAPDKVKIVKHYTGKRPIFDEFGITRQIKSSFGKTSTMSSGAYIVIEGTEAMHVVDVNSGPKMQKLNQEESALAVNMESAEEIARQLRLRDIGGLIIIDFIDMRNADNKSKLFKAMKEFMKGDRAQHTILPLSKFGLMQITRQRVRPAVKIDTTEKCPVCRGTGKSTASTLVTDNIERDLNYILQSRPDSSISLEVHPFVMTYLKKGLPSIQMKWAWKYKKWIKITENRSFHLYKYVFTDSNNDEIRLG